MAIAIGLALIGTASAEDWKPVGQFGYYGVGDAREIEKGHVFWVGEFGGTFFSDKKDGLFDRAGVRCPAVNDIDTNKKKNRAMGYCIISDAAGDQAYASWKCEGDIATCTGTFDYTGGTGKYEKISGNNTFAAKTATNWGEGGPVSGTSIWNR